MSFQIRDLKTRFLNAVADRVAPMGFDNRRGQSFLRQVDGVLCALHVSLIEHDCDFDATADVAVRIDRLEELLQKHSGSATVASTKLFSLGAELGNIARGSQQRWSVDQADDIQRVAGELVDSFTGVGIPYLNKYGRLERALEAFSDDGPSGCLHSPINAERAKRAVASAWLLNDMASVSSLAESKCRFLAERGDAGLQPFREFVASLRGEDGKGDAIRS
jgi:hypothetical protein